MPELIFGTTHIQAGMLFQSLSEPDSGVNVEQLVTVRHQIPGLS